MLRDGASWCARFRRTGAGAVPGRAPARPVCGALLAGLLLAATGCGDAALGRVGVYRMAPDTLVVAVAPGAALFAAAPETLAITVSDARGFVLAERRVPGRRAPAWAVPVPDFRLPSRGQLMVEVCGRLRRRLRCEQVPVAATPKRFRTTARIGYPAAGDRERAAVRVASAFERFDGGAWHALPPPPGLSYALRVWVEGGEADAVQVPLVPGRDTVSLTADAGYDPYWIRLNERVFYGEGARVHLRVTARWDGGSATAAEIVRTVEPPSRAERAESVESFARGAARALARTFGVAPDSATARVGRWRFDRIRQRYEIDLAVGLRDSLGAPMTLRGKLLVGETGQQAGFREVPADSTRPAATWRLGRLAPAGR